jgi:hypothetical protein
MNDIRDIKPPIPLDIGPVWWWIGVAAGLSVLLGLGVWRARRTAPDRRLRRTLLRATTRLAAATPSLDDKTFAYRLADLLRQALARRTGIAAASLTTEELLPRLAATDLPPPLCEAVAAALRRADPARYAASLPTAPPDGVVQEGLASPSWPPEASPLLHPHLHPSPSRITDLHTLRRLLRRNRPWPF